MEHYKKFLQNLPARERAILLQLLENLIQRHFTGLDIKKLKGYPNAYRVRKGKIRIIYIDNKLKIEIVDITFRKDAYR